MSDIRDVIAEAIQPAGRRHGQLCPVARRNADLSACDCWIKEQVYMQADKAVAALLAADMVKPA